MKRKRKALQTHAREEDLTQRGEGARRNSFFFAPLQLCDSFFSTANLLILVSLSVTAFACAQERGRVPTEVQEVVTRIGEQIAQEQYDQIYNESSERWKQQVTLEESNETFKTMRTKLGKVELRSLHSAAEQENSGGVLKGHVFILSYQTRFERGEGMETFTLLEENGQWRLARYFVNSTALNNPR